MPYSKMESQTKEIQVIETRRNKNTLYLNLVVIKYLTIDKVNFVSFVIEKLCFSYMTTSFGEMISNVHLLQKFQRNI